MKLKEILCPSPVYYFNQMQMCLHNFTHPLDKERFCRFVCACTRMKHPERICLLKNYLIDNHNFDFEEASDFVIKVELGLDIIRQYRRFFNDETYRKIGL